MITLDTILKLNQYSEQELQLELIRRHKNGEAIVAYLREKQHLWEAVLLDEIEFYPSKGPPRYDLEAMKTLRGLALDSNTWDASQLYVYTASESAALELLEGGDALKLWTHFAAIIFDDRTSHSILGFYSPSDTSRVMIIRLSEK